MSNQDDPEWEIVDSLPKKRKPSRQRMRIRIPKKLIIGAVICLALLCFGPTRLLLFNLVKNLFAYWWFFAAAIGYWLAKRKLAKRG